MNFDSHFEFRSEKKNIQDRAKRRTWSHFNSYFPISYYITSSNVMMGKDGEASQNPFLRANQSESVT